MSPHLQVEENVHVHWTTQVLKWLFIYSTLGTCQPEKLLLLKLVVVVSSRIVNDVPKVIKRR